MLSAHTERLDEQGGTACFAVFIESRVRFGEELCQKKELGTIQTQTRSRRILKARALCFENRSKLEECSLTAQLEEEEQVSSWLWKCVGRQCHLCSTCAASRLSEDSRHPAVQGDDKE